MSMFVLSAEGWSFNEAADRRFRRITTVLGIIFVILAVVIPFLELFGPQEGGGETTDTTYVNILPDAEIAKQVEEPKPAEEEAKKPEPAKEVKKPEPKEPAPKTQATPKPEPTQEQLEQAAREVAKSSGINALADQLADLRDNSLSGLDAARPLSDEVISARPGAGGGGAASVASSAASGSGGIGTASNTSPRTQSGAGLGQRRTTVVQAPKGIGPDLTKPGLNGDSRLAGRSVQEIQELFDRNKAAFAIIFKRFERENGELEPGQVLLSIVIEPNGTVSSCKVLRSPYGKPDLEDKIVQRVLMMRFKDKPVPQFKIDYPLIYLPG